MKKPFQKQIMIMGFISFSFMLNAAETTFENLYVRPSIDAHVGKFISAEVVVTLNESIHEYNQSRKNIEELKKRFVSADEIKNLESLKDQNFEMTKVILPEIKYVDGVYTISEAETKATFSAKDLLLKQFYLNGVLIQYKNHGDLKTQFKKVSRMKSFIDFFIERAYAGFVEDTKANRLIIASIISLNNIFEDAGIICNIKCDTMKVNFQKIAQRISRYNDQCDQAVNEQTDSFDRAKNIDYYSSVKVIGDPVFQEGEGINQLLTKMNQLAKKDKDVNKMLDDKLKSDLVGATCEKQVSPFLSSGLSNITHYANIDRENVDTVSVPSVCGKINSLKQCLNDLYTSSKMISQTLKRKGYTPAETNYSNLESQTAIGK